MGRNKKPRRCFLEFGWVPLPRAWPRPSLGSHHSPLRWWPVRWVCLSLVRPAPLLPRKPGQRGQPCCRFCSWCLRHGARNRHSSKWVELSKWIVKYRLYFILTFGCFLNLVTIASCSKTRERKQLPSGSFQREGRKALSFSPDCCASFLRARQGPWGRGRGQRWTRRCPGGLPDLGASSGASCHRPMTTRRGSCILTPARENPLHADNRDSGLAQGGGRNPEKGLIWSSSQRSAFCPIWRGEAGGGRSKGRAAGPGMEGRGVTAVWGGRLGRGGLVLAGPHLEGVGCQAEEFRLHLGGQEENYSRPRSGFLPLHHPSPSVPSPRASCRGLAFSHTVWFGFWPRPCQSQGYLVCEIP